MKHEMPVVVTTWTMLCAAAVMSVFLCPCVFAGTDLVADYTFAEGAGAVLKDHSGNGHDGTIHGAKWVKTDAGSALSFQEGAYVDLGAKPDFNLRGDSTVAAWIKLEAATYPGEMTNWHILNGGETHPRSGYMFRIEGGSGTVDFRTCSGGQAPYVESHRTIENNSVHYLVATKKGKQGAIYIDGILDNEVQLVDPAPAERPFTISAPVQSFNGLIEDLAIYRRALSTEEIMKLYQEGAGSRGKDTSWIGKIQLTAYCHYDQGTLTVEAGFMGVLPIQPGQQASLELGQPGKGPVQVEAIKTMPNTGRYEVTFPIQGLPEGKYQVAAVVKDAGGQVLNQCAFSFAIPYEPVKVAAPSEKAVASLPKPPEPAPYQFSLAAGGGFQVSVAGETYPVESAFSWPNGDFNLMGASPVAGGKCERDWKVATRKVDDNTYQVSASGKFYMLERTIRLFPTHINVQDTLSNKTAEPIAILFKNSVVTKDRGITTGYLAGKEVLKPRAGSETRTNPTLFLKKPGLGIGLVALDDVFIFQSKADFDLNRSALYSTQFALDKNASYTLEWSLYLNRSADYYDFINAIRKDEGRNGRVDGGLALYYDQYLESRGIPTKEYVALRRIKYITVGDLNHVPDDPGVSLCGIEFTDVARYPKTIPWLRDHIAAARKAHPKLTFIFPHVAHSLYATNKPAEAFPDSRVIGPDGKQHIYDGEDFYRRYFYFTKERVDQGWRYWVVYPTLDNSYGKELLRSVDVMVDEAGCNGVFMDGFGCNYGEGGSNGGEYTYDRWDGHTAEIDPATKTIKRKMGSVLLLSQDALVAFCRKMRDKGGPVVANNFVITRTIGKETYIIYDWELVEGPWTHLASTPAALSNGYGKNEKEFYYDALNKLKWGDLTFYYGDYPNNGKDIFTHSPIVAEMFPITFEEIHADYIKGQERLITARPGVYGWPGDQDLHFAYRYDGQGWDIPAGYLTTVDANGVRTEVTLSPKEAAVVKKVPVRLKASEPVNVVFRQYDGKGITLGINGKGEVTLTVAAGEFEIKPGAAYLVKTDMETRTTADPEGRLSFTCRLDGPLEVRIAAAGE